MPGKNIRLLNGKPLIKYTFDAAAESKLIDKTILTTDSLRIAETARSTSVEVPFMRPVGLSLDTTPTADVIKHALNFFDSRGEFYDIICLLQPTCPFRNKGCIDRCIENFITSGADCLVSVKKVPHEYNPQWVFEADDTGFLKIATGDKKIIPSRHLLPAAFARDESVYVFKADNIRKQNSIYGDTISYLETDSLWHINIDTAEDWQRAEMIANMLCLVN